MDPINIMLWYCYGFSYGKAIAVIDFLNIVWFLSSSLVRCKGRQSERDTASTTKMFKCHLDISKTWYAIMQFWLPDIYRFSIVYPFKQYYWQ